MLNPRCETNKFSSSLRLFFTFFLLSIFFCNVDITLRFKETVSLVSNQQKKIVTQEKKKRQKVFGGLNNISILQHYTRGMCTNICACYSMGILCFLTHLAPIPPCSPRRPLPCHLNMYTHEGIIRRKPRFSYSVLWRIFSPSGIFWWGLKRWKRKREEKEVCEGKWTFFRSRKQRHR